MEELLLKKYFSLNPPASIDVINEIKRKISIKLPKTYEDFLLICNGLYSRGNLTLHEIQDLPERNNDYEVGKYLPDYFMIGDDNGGQAILINEVGEVFEVAMGVMDIAFVEQSAKSIADLLINYQGKTLNER